MGYGIGFTTLFVYSCYYNYNGLSLLTSLVSSVGIAVVVSVLLFGVVNSSLHQT